MSVLRKALFCTYPGQRQTVEGGEGLEELQGVTLDSVMDSGSAAAAGRSKDAAAAGNGRMLRTTVGGASVALAPQTSQACIWYVRDVPHLVTREDFLEPSFTWRRLLSLLPFIFPAPSLPDHLPHSLSISYTLFFVHSHSDTWSNDFRQIESLRLKQRKNGPNIHTIYPSVEH